MANNTANQTSFAGRMISVRQMEVITELVKHTKPVPVSEIYDGLLKKIPDNQISTILDTLARGSPPLVRCVTKSRDFMGQEILVELWELSSETKKFVVQST